VIAGDLAGHSGPGSTQTPITYLHATVTPGSRLTLPWPRGYNALVYALAGHGYAGVERRPVGEGQLAVYGPDGDAITMAAADDQPSNSAAGWDILVLGGQPIREPVARYGPFVMNTREEIAQAVADFRAGRMGTVPAQRVPHRTSADETSA
jgi:redox-sensitive bicupin YhaK (pirin superfamily)